MVLYNAVVAAQNQAAQQQQGLVVRNPVLRVRGNVLAPYCHNLLQRALLNLRNGFDVPYVINAITPNQVATHRPSYINAILIQSRGHVERGPYN